MPSTPGPPLFLRTCLHAISKFFRSHTSYISRSFPAGLSELRFAVSGSVPWPLMPRGSPWLPSAKARRICVYWVFCRCPLMSHESYLPLPIVWAFNMSLRPCDPWLFLPFRVSVPIERAGCPCLLLPLLTSAPCSGYLTAPSVPDSGRDADLPR